jgi:hypothetical protein
MSNTINGRTPDEIKKGLECCKPVWRNGHWATCSDDCPFMNEGVFCRNVLTACTLALLYRLEHEHDEVLQKNQQLERERDAAVEDMTELMKGSESCTFCKHYVEDGDYCAKPPTSIFSNGMCWQWRGVQEVE